MKRFFPFALAAAAVLAAAVGDASAFGRRCGTSTTRVRFRQTTTIRSSAGGCSSCAASAITTSTSLRVSGPGDVLIESAPAPRPANGIGQVGGAAANDALDEVNAARAARGLPPYVRDPALTQAAQTVAIRRASTRTTGHTANDFSGLPPGSTAAASGCAAWPPQLGWGSCATYDRYTYAGAAWAQGPDGLRYMQLFVR